jgi:hypothetical protein
VSLEQWHTKGDLYPCDDCRLFCLSRRTAFSAIEAALGNTEGSMIRQQFQQRGALAVIILTFFAAFTAVNVALAADGFRIETKVFIGEEEEAVSENTTLFSEGIVYDFLEQPQQTAVFRKPIADKPGRFILLSKKQRARTEISTDQLVRAMEKVRTWAGRQRDPFLKFAANPEFEETFEPQGGQLILASHLENYTVSTTPAEHPEAMQEYREFLDWYAQLNSLLSGGAPPDPRLKLNEALARHKALPITVELLRSGEKEPLRAEHDFTWRISQNDVQRIEDVREALASYRSVSNEEFLRLTREANPAE